MDMDDHPPVRADDPVAHAARQDLDPLSVEELQARIAALDAEIVRTRTRLARAAADRAVADALFKR